MRVSFLTFYCELCKIVKGCYAVTALISPPDWARSYAQVDKNQLSVMYAFEYFVESALKEFMPANFDAVLQAARFAADSDLMFVEDCIDSRCCYFIDLSPAQRKKQLTRILCSCDSLWGKFSREEQDIRMLNKMNTTDWDWPEKIKW